MKKLMVLSMIMFFSMVSIRSEARTNNAGDNFFVAAFDFASYWSQFFNAPAMGAAELKNGYGNMVASNAGIVAVVSEEEDLKAFSIWPAMTSRDARYFQSFSHIMSDIAYNYNQTYDMDLNPEKIFESN